MSGIVINNMCRLYQRLQRRRTVGGLTSEWRANAHWLFTGIGLRQSLYKLH